MNRSTFLKKTLLGGLAIASAPSLMSLSQKKRHERLIILHTNDTHSNLEPFAANHAKFPGQGGVARRYEMIQEIRSKNEQVLLIDAGDIFQGTPYFNRYGGEIEMKVMQYMGYEAATMGNHDFDGGMEGFLKAKTHTTFPFLCSNYDFKNTPIDGHTENYRIIRKGNIKVGIFGLGVELKGLVPDKLFGETVYLDPLERAKDMVAALRREKCDLIICLSHLGYSYNNDKLSDLKLAEKVGGIDLIIGGHTHTFLEKPTEVTNADGQLTLVNQVGWAGLRLGHIEIDIEKRLFGGETSLEVR